MKTKTSFTKSKDIKRMWFLVDARDQNLGRMAAHIATYLMGKNKVSYLPYLDCGDYVIVINAQDIKVSQRKLKSKKHQWHSGYPGGFKEKTLEQMLKEKPEQVIRLAVKRMLPQNRLGRAMFRKLKIYRGSEHNQEAQQPQKLEIPG